MLDANHLEKILINLEAYIRKRNFSGSDPYDALNLDISNIIDSKISRNLFTQFFLYSPINFRKFFRKREGVNPKSMGLAISSYCNFHSLNLLNKDKCLKIARTLRKWLLKNNSKGYNNLCWGYNFPWQNKNRLLKANIPTIVNSSFIGSSFLDLYDLDGDVFNLEISESIANFIIEDLNILDFNEGICFSYSPLEKNTVHNANVLGASFLSKLFSRTNKNKYLDYSTKAIDFTISKQLDDGMWLYDYIPSSGNGRHQVDWHQGFIIDSIYDYIENISPASSKYLDSIITGAKFYKEKIFLSTGQSHWRWPQLWPLDIHNQSQGIITFSKISNYDTDFLSFSNKIAKWTVKHMFDKRGFFYYQQWPFITNRISYMRWNQAWMLLALSSLAVSNKRKR